MKNLIFFVFFFCSSAFLCFSQDIIVLRSGDEIPSKVQEVTTDVVKYKKWSNQDGPIYSTLVKAIFMIKYQNGSKDVFDSSSKQSSNSDENINDTYIGIWHPLNYNGNSVKTVLTISKAMKNYLVVYNVWERVDEYFHSADGSFQEIGHIENGSLIINPLTKISLLNENKILMQNNIFIRDPNTIKPKSTSVTSNNQSVKTTQSTSSTKSNIDFNYLNRNEMKLTTIHLGVYNFRYSNGEYKSLYKENQKTEYPKYYKKIFYKSNYLSIEGATLYNSNEDLEFPLGSPIKLDFKVDGLAYSDDVAKCTLEFQLQDSTGVNLYSEKIELEFFQRGMDFSKVISVNIEPEKWKSEIGSNTYFLNFIITDKQDKSRILQGFAEFAVK